MTGPTQTTRRAPIDVMDDVLRPLLGSMAGTSAAVSCWLALRKAGWLQDEPMEDVADD